MPSQELEVHPSHVQLESRWRNKFNQPGGVDSGTREDHSERLRTLRMHNDLCKSTGLVKSVLEAPEPVIAPVQETLS
jgi:hypothetical protein